MGKFHPNDNVSDLLELIGKNVAGRSEVDILRGDLSQIPGKISEELAGFANKLVAAVEGIQVENPFEKLEEIFTAQKNQIDQQSQELAELQDQNQRLLGVIGYGHATPNSELKTNGFNRWQRLSMDSQIGPMVGMHINDGKIYLESKGLFFIQCQTTHDWYGVRDKVQTSVRVYDPQGNLHAEKTSVEDSSTQATVTVLMPVTVPSAGYYLEVHVAGALGRTVFPGQNRTFLSVDKRSQEEE